MTDLMLEDETVEGSQNLTRGYTGVSSVTPRTISLRSAHAPTTRLGPVVADGNSGPEEGAPGAAGAAAQQQRCNTRRHSIAHACQKPY